MRSLIAAVMLCGGVATFGLAQVKTIPTLHPSPLEAFALHPTASVIWSEQVGHIDSVEARATITVIVVEDTSRVPNRMRGVRIELLTGSAHDQVYLEEARLEAVKNALDEIASGIGRCRADPDANAPIEYSGAAEFWRPNEHIHTLSAAYYIAPDSCGLSLSAKKGEEFRFPDRSPATLAAALGQAIAILAKQ